jgi:3-oxoadipate enol-lactonase
MPIARLGDIDLNYEHDRGGGETVVLVNGLADDLSAWQPQLGALLDAGYGVLRIDNRGAGRSSKPPGPYTTAQLAADVHALVGELEIGPFHLAGASLGGMIAQEYALAYDGLLSLTLACTCAAPGAFSARLFALWGDLARSGGVALALREMALWSFSPESFEHPGGAVRQFDEWAGQLPQPTHAFLAQLEALRAHDTRRRVEGLSVPTLVLAGERDALIPTPLSHRLSEQIPRSVWSTVPGGHACLWEHPEPVNQTLLHFLQAVR